MAMALGGDESGSKNKLAWADFYSKAPTFDLAAQLADEAVPNNAPCWPIWRYGFLLSLKKFAMLIFLFLATLHEAEVSVLVGASDRKHSTALWI